VEQGLVVLTKADLVDDETRELVRLEVRDLVAGSFLERAPVVAASAQTGEGLDAIRAELLVMANAIAHRQPNGAARLPIDRAFTMQGFGTVVTGTLVSGRIRAEDELVLIPGDARVRVRGLQVHGKRRDEALSGQRTAINLGGVDAERVTRGQTLATPGAVTITRRVDAVMDLLPAARPLRHGARVRFHQGTNELLGRVSIAGSTASEVAPGDRAYVRLRLEADAAVTRGDRFILRAYSPPITIGGGEIVDPDPPRGAVRTAAAGQRFAALTRGTDDAVLQMVSDTGGMGISLAALTSRVGVAPPDVSAWATRVTDSGRARHIADRLVSTDMMQVLSQSVLKAIGDFHRAQPLADGIPREEVRERIFARAHPEVFEQVLQDLDNAKKITGRDRLALAGHRLELSAEETRARDLIEAAYKSRGLKPPDAATLASANGLTGALVEKMTALLLRHKILARVDTLLFHVDALQALKSEIQALKATAPGGRATVDVATFKDRFGITRKFAIPLLEWLDRERVTRRVDQTRVVL
jgi:selenocysteine-specific elongation factor